MSVIKTEKNSEGQVILEEYSDGTRCEIYYGDKPNIWGRQTFNADNDAIRLETSSGYWWEAEYIEHHRFGKFLSYFEDSEGFVIGARKKHSQAVQAKVQKTASRPKKERSKWEAVLYGLLFLQGGFIGISIYALSEGKIEDGMFGIIVYAVCFAVTVRTLREG